MDSYPGVWRGRIADTNDPEQRKRYRVRVVSVHRDEIPNSALPWAETCFFAGAGFGDIPHFEAGDIVFVSFERGDRRFPVILGGWLAYVGGIPDMPAEQTGDYENQQRLWLRSDRFGNRVLMDPVKGYIELQSTEATVTIHGEEGSIKVSADASVLVTAPQVRVLEATGVTIESGTVVAEIADECSLICNGTTTIRAADTINIGRYEDPLVGALVPKTTANVDIRADTLLKAESGGTLDVDVAGQADVDVIGDININCSSTINARATTELNIHSDGPVNVDGSTILVQSTGGLLRVEGAANIEIESASNVSVTVGASAEVNVVADCAISVGGNATLEVGANCEVTVGGTATIDATTLTKLASDTRIELSAPTIDITADTLLSLVGEAQATLDGGTVLIG